MRKQNRKQKTNKQKKKKKKEKEEDEQMPKQAIFVKLQQTLEFAIFQQ